MCYIFILFYNRKLFILTFNLSQSLFFLEFLYLDYNETKPSSHQRGVEMQKLKTCIGNLLFARRLLSQLFRYIIRM